MKWYAGIGSRSAPHDVLKDIHAIGCRATHCGWGLRSGAAKGCDATFESACDELDGPKQIFLPWARFNGHMSELYNSAPLADKIAASIHPTYNRLTPASMKLIARNMHQVLGPNLDDPVRCVVCWTPDGCETFDTYGKSTGGTGSAIALASIHGIPVFNLFNSGRLTQAVEYLSKL
jgi:hypothetical protein